MIEVMPETTDDVLGVRASGKLCRADYRDVLAPRIRSLLHRSDAPRVLFLIDEDFDGWSAGGAWANTILDVRHRKGFDKVAMVGAPRWEEWCVKVPAALLMKGELRTFRRGQLASAWEWLRA